MNYIKLKRCFDLTTACILLLILSPLLMVVALIVRITIGDPIIFSQQRPGYNGLIFKLYKFRSMKDVRDGAGELLPDEQRINKIGLVLRSLSLDELPALVNVLKGDMSLVGPRPLLVEYLPLYSDSQKRRHNVRPGITGLAQVNGRNALDWTEKFAYDLEYVESYNFVLDMKILLKTVTTVLQRRGISEGGSIGMEKFGGNE